MSSDENLSSEVLPVTPNDVISVKIKSFPSIVFLTFNHLIKDNFNGNFAKVEATDAIKMMVAMGLEESEIILKDWLNVEGAYEDVGWEVHSTTNLDGSKLSYNFKKKR